MLYSVLADVIVGIHFAFLAFTLLGQVLIVIGLLCRWEWVRNPWFRSIHLVFIVFVAFEYAIQLECPLTTWEENLRELAGEKTKDDYSFIGRLLQVIFFEDVDSLHWGFGLAYSLFALMVVATFVFGPPRRRKAATEPEFAPQACEP